MGHDLRSSQDQIWTKWDTQSFGQSKIFGYPARTFVDKVITKYGLSRRSTFLLLDRPNIKDLPDIQFNLSTSRASSQHV